MIVTLRVRGLISFFLICLCLWLFDILSTYLLLKQKQLIAQGLNDVGRHWINISLKNNLAD